MAIKKLCLVIFGVLFCLLFTIYIKYFNHGPPEAIMEANRKKLEKSDGFKDTGDVFESLIDDKDKLTSYENDVDYEKDPVKSKRHWDNFIRENKFVSIGEIYNKCGKHHNK